MKDPKLPAGWYMKPRKDKGSESSASYYYLTEAFQQFDSTKAAVRYIVPLIKTSDYALNGV